MLTILPSPKTQSVRFSPIHLPKLIHYTCHYAIARSATASASNLEHVVNIIETDVREVFLSNHGFFCSSGATSWSALTTCWLWSTPRSTSWSTWAFAVEVAEVARGWETSDAFDSPSGARQWSEAVSLSHYIFILLRILHIIIYAYGHGHCKVKLHE